MPNPPWPRTLSMRYSKRRNPIGSVMFAAAGLGTRTRRGSLAAREALLCEAAMADGSSTVLSDPPVGGSNTVELLPPLAAMAISSRSPCASAPGFGLSLIPCLPVQAPLPDPITLPQDQCAVGPGKPRKDNHLDEIL